VLRAEEPELEERGEGAEPDNEPDGELEPVTVPTVRTPR